MGQTGFIEADFLWLDVLVAKSHLFLAMLIFYHGKQETNNIACMMVMDTHLLNLAIWLGSNLINQIKNASQLNAFAFNLTGYISLDVFIIPNF